MIYSKCLKWNCHFMTKVAFFHQQQNAKPDVALFTHSKQATEKCPKSVFNFFKVVKNALSFCNTVAFF